MSDPVDLKQLESLSCLKISDDQKDKMISSINDVFGMLHAIDNVDVPKQSTPLLNPTKLVADAVDDTFVFNKNEKTNGINSQDGLFLAPKVLNKD